MMQTVIAGEGSRKALGRALASRGLGHGFLVCDPHFLTTDVKSYLDGLPIELTVFTSFSPNPKYEEVKAGVEAFRASGADHILAAGGGSALDTAKAVKLFSKSDLTECPIGKPYADTGIFLAAFPTTAGTGSESTRHAVVYLNGVKQSISHDSILPDLAVLEPGLLATLPVYQRKCTLLDALSQATESYWSVHSTEESRALAAEAIPALLQNIKEYTGGASRPETDLAVMQAANLAGAAINITATTAPHAMSYKLTSLYGLPHGHAVILNLPGVWDYTAAHTEETADPRGAAFLKERISELCKLYGASDPAAATAFLRALLADLGLTAPAVTPEEEDLLVSSVNPERLGNHPVPLNADTLRQLYRAM